MVDTTEKVEMLHFWENNNMKKLEKKHRKGAQQKYTTRDNTKT